MHREIGAYRTKNLGHNQKWLTSPCDNAWRACYNDYKVMNRIERKVEKVDGIVRRDKWRIEDEDIISSSQCQVHSLESGNIQPEGLCRSQVNGLAGE